MSSRLADTVAEDRTGQVLLNKYRLVRRLGEGGMGSVYEAVHVVVGRRFAVKFLKPELTESAEALLRFRREARAAGALENEHIAAVTDFDVAEDGVPFLVMEFLAGESLARLLAREGPLPVSRAVGAVLQICEGLEAAHAAGIIHRDLKPDNVFVVRRKGGGDLVKLLDFGVAKLVGPDSDGSITHSGAMLGTPFYMAPEQARGERLLDHRVDIYAAGVILYELLTGRKPHPGDSYNSILAHILSEAPEPLESFRPELPQGLVDVVSRALARDPSARPASARELARALAPFAGPPVEPRHSQFELRATTTATPTLASDGATPERPRPRRRMLAIAGALAAITGLALYAGRAVAPPTTTAPSAELAPARALGPSESALPSSAGPANATATASASALAAPSVVPSSNIASVHAPVASASVVRSGHASGRPSGRPEAPISAQPAPTRRATAAPRQAQGSSGNSAPSPVGRRVRFDTENPYE